MNEKEQSGRVLALNRRGGVRSLGKAPSDAATAWSPPRLVVHSRMWPLLLILPMFVQIFHYMIDVGPIYLLSKAWAVMMMPFAIYGLMALRTRFALLYVLTLTYVMGVTPVLSMAWLGNGIGDAVINSVKVWSLTYYFSMLGVLMWLGASADDIIDAILRLGFATVIVMWVLWHTVPGSWYSGDPRQSRLFLAEYERGNRLLVPMTFALLTAYYALARMFDGPKLWQIVIVPVVLYTEIHLFKERVAMAASVVVVGGMLFFRLPRLWRSILLLGTMMGGFAGVALVLQHGQDVTAKLGNSLTIRQNSIALLQNYLSDQPLRWIFGAGGASRVGKINMADIVGRRDFFLADLGWAGIIFEFGAVGAIIMLVLYLSVLRWAWSTSVAADPRHRAMIAALIAYIAYLTLCTVIYSPVYTPGELASLTALVLYLANIARRGGQALKDTRTLD
jgi:hypothetical protein